MDLTDATILAFTAAADADPNLPNCADTCLVVVRVPKDSLPDAIIPTTISYPEHQSLLGQLNDAIERMYLMYGR